MYHRYMPSENGQYQRQTVGQPPKPQPKPQPTMQQLTYVPEPKKPLSKPKSVPQTPQPCPTLPLSILDKLLPGMDRGDLLVILLLLLLLSEGTEDANSLAMTLAIFLFLQ